MTTYAIVQLGGKQFKVSEGDTLVVNRLENESDKEFASSDVLLIASDAGTKIGTPLVEKASVTFKVTEHLKGDKVKIFKYKSKSRYRRTNGHRQPLTTVTVTGIKA